MPTPRRSATSSRFESTFFKSTFEEFFVMANALTNIKAGNPGLNDKTFSGLPHPALESERMTLQGTVNKSFLLLLVLMGTALWPWSQYLATGNPGVVALPRSEEHTSELQSLRHLVC